MGFFLKDGLHDYLQPLSTHSLLPLRLLSSVNHATTSLFLASVASHKGQKSWLVTEFCLSPSFSLVSLFTH